MHCSTSLTFDLEPNNSEFEGTFHNRQQVAWKDRIETETKIIKQKMAKNTKEKSFRCYFSPLTTLHTWNIQYHLVAGNSLELKSSVLSCLLSFYSLKSFYSLNNE